MTEPGRKTAEGARAMRAPAPTRTARGTTAAETAAVLPVVAATMLVLAWLLSLVAVQIRIVDAARETARVAARGDDDAVAIASGRRVAPGAATFALRRLGDHVVVEVEAEVEGPGGVFSFLPLPKAHATATSTREDR